MEEKEEKKLLSNCLKQYLNARITKNSKELEKARALKKFIEENIDQKSIKYNVAYDLITQLDNKFN